LFASGSAEAFAGELDAMGVVDEAVQDGVGVSGVSNNLIPGGQGKLGGDDRRSAAVSFLEDFEQVMAGAGVEGFEGEVVEDEEVGAAEGLDEARMAPIASGERQIFAELRPAMIENGAIVAAGFLADGAGEPTLANAGRADQGQIVMGIDPFSLRELLKQGAVQTADGAIVASSTLACWRSFAARSRAVRRLSFRQEVSRSRSRASQSACGKSFAWPAAVRSAKALAIP
jgi:hypothetical protein